MSSFFNLWVTFEVPVEHLTGEDQERIETQQEELADNRDLIILWVVITNMKINCSGILYRLGNKRTKNDALGKTTIEKQIEEEKPAKEPEKEHSKRWD